MGKQWRCGSSHPTSWPSMCLPLFFSYFSLHFLSFFSQELLIHFKKRKNIVSRKISLKPSAFSISVITFFTVTQRKVLLVLCNVIFTPSYSSVLVLENPIKSSFIPLAVRNSHELMPPVSHIHPDTAVEEPTLKRKKGPRS